MLPRPSRGLWIASIAVGIGCVAALGYALVTDWNTPVDTSMPRPSGRGTGGGFSLGLMIGVGVGIVIGSLIGLRRKNQ